MSDSYDDFSFSPSSDLFSGGGDYGYLTGDFGGGSLFGGGQDYSYEEPTFQTQDTYDLFSGGGDYGYLTGDFGPQDSFGRTTSIGPEYSDPLFGDTDYGYLTGDFGSAEPDWFGNSEVEPGSYPMDNTGIPEEDINALGGSSSAAGGIKDLISKLLGTASGAASGLNKAANSPLGQLAQVLLAMAAKRKSQKNQAKNISGAQQLARVNSQIALAGRRSGGGLEGTRLGLANMNTAQRDPMSYVQPAPLIQRPR